ncbi:MAG TPA: hypothetical protein VJN70_13215 [Gemmatimonadaceae bacterium]|nr:hypothetical protein [Gemmatimonadaceae bacterium]
MIHSKPNDSWAPAHRHSQLITCAAQPAAVSRTTSRRRVIDAAPILRFSSVTLATARESVIDRLPTEASKEK